MPNGCPDQVNLPHLWRGETFRVRFDPPDGVVWTDYQFVMTIDPPTGDRVTLTNDDAEAIDPDTGAVILAKAADYFLTAPLGEYEYHFWYTPPGGDPDHIVFGFFEVVDAKNGPPA